MKDLKAADPRWCTGCGDYTILVGMRKFMVNHQMDPASTLNISGIGCSGRVPHYMNTYGFHTIHGRAVPVALGAKLANPDLKVFIHSGDGDSLSIGGNHLMHGIHKNFNCVYICYDNQIYGLTKNQSSPTSRQGLSTQSQPSGTYLNPINPVRFALGMGASFVATTAEWLGKHMVDTIDAAFRHSGFSFIHIAQRCPKFNPKAWDYKESDWITFMEHETGIVADLKGAPHAKVVTHDPSDMIEAFKFAGRVPDVFGLYYREEKVMYDEVIKQELNNAPKKDASKLLAPYRI